MRGWEKKQTNKQTLRFYLASVYEFFLKKIVFVKNYWKLFFHVLYNGSLFKNLKCF